MSHTINNLCSGEAAFYFRLATGPGFFYSIAIIQTEKRCWAPTINSSKWSLEQGGRTEELTRWLCDFPRLRCDLLGSDNVICLYDKTRPSPPVILQDEQKFSLVLLEAGSFVFLKQGTPSLCRGSAFRKFCISPEEYVSLQSQSVGWVFIKIQLYENVCQSTWRC